MVQQVVSPIRKEKKVEITDPDFRKRIPDEDDTKAEAFVEQMIWGDEPRCGRCGSTSVYKPTGKPPMRWRCRSCRKYFSVRIGTVMYKSRLPYWKWVKAIHTLLSDSTGETARKIRLSVGVQRRIVWSLAHRIREGMVQEHIKLSGTIQWDETYVGANIGRMHAKKKPPRTPNPKTGKLTRNWKENKVTVVGGVNESGFVVAFRVEDDNSPTLQKAVLDNVRIGSTVWTDGAPAYEALPYYGFGHDFVLHGKGEYVNKRGAHTNRIESFWSDYKEGIKGTYNLMSDKHIHRYIREFCFRHNMRQSNDFETIGLVIKGFVGKYLPWEDLVRDGPVYRKTTRDKMLAKANAGLSSPA